MTASSGTIRRATADDLTPAARVLANAFASTPPFQWTVPDNARRPAILRDWFELLLANVWIPHGRVEVTSDVCAIAVWDSPGAGQLSEPQADGLARRSAAVWGEFAPRARKMRSLLDGSHPDQPHHNLVFIATDPARQGQGVGSDLLAEGLRQNDHSGIGSHLEAASPANLRFYKRFGFRETGLIKVPDGPTIWAMWRDAAPQTAR
jgi:ribosomal protein S18 acetylase RimI-like enzyme